MYLLWAMGVFRYKTLMPIVMNFALDVEMTLLRSSLTVRRSTVGVPQLPR